MHQLSEERRNELEIKWLTGTITDEEAELYAIWYNSNQDNDIYVEECLASDENNHEKKMLKNILGAINESSENKRNTNILLHNKWQVAASIFFILGIGIYLIFTLSGKKADNETLFLSASDIMPAQKGAVLTLDNGTKVILDSLSNGWSATQSTATVTVKHGQLVYQVPQSAASKEIVYNTISTPRGRQYNLALPDGTKVWLNAGSSLHYPVSFDDTLRVVELEGEGYFEVKHDAKHPFRIKAAGYTIEDIGTSFDVNAYNDEPQMKTTLVEGSVKIGNIYLKPNQQAVISQSGISVKTIKSEDAIAWKNGYFSFTGADINEIMRQISRWYDVDVKFEGQPNMKLFEGEIGRSLTLKQLFDGLKRMNVHFKIEGKVVTIFP